MSDIDKQIYDVLIVGTGHGGAQAAIQLRQLGFEGSIAMIGEEPDPPYERPPLSKDYLTGDKDFERMLVRPASFWAERDIAIVPETRVTSVDPDAQHLTALTQGNGDSLIGYGKLVWATGGRPRPMLCPGGENRAIHAIRNRGDVDAIREELAAAQHVLVIGGGYIGLEAAAGLRKLGIRVTLVEMADRLLSRVAGETLSAFFADCHRAHGVDLHLASAVTAFEENPAGLAATLGDGSVIAADMAIAGIGIVPEVGPLIAAGAAGGDGVDIDPACRTSLEHIYAIGDCAAHANRWADGEHIRVESVQNAHDMARVAALDILGETTQYDALPWFWSNQYDVKLQTVGLSTGHDASVTRGDPASGSFSVVYLRNGRVIALDCVNRAKDYVQGRKLIEARAEIPPERLADIDMPLKEMMAD